MSCTGSQDRGESWIRSGPMEFSCHMNTWGGGLYFRKLLSPPLRSGYAVPQTKEKVPQQQMCTNAGFASATAIPRESNEVSSFFMGMVPMLEKSSSAARGHPALKQRFPPAFRVEAVANTSPASCQRTAEANRAPSCLLQQINTAASTYSLHLHTQCRGFFLRVLMSPFSGCF